MKRMVTAVHAGPAEALSVCDVLAALLLDRRIEELSRALPHLPRGWISLYTKSERRMDFLAHEFDIERRVAGPGGVTVTFRWLRSPIAESRRAAEWIGTAPTGESATLQGYPARVSTAPDGLSTVAVLMGGIQGSSLTAESSLGAAALLRLVGNLRLTDLALEVAARPWVEGERQGVGLDETLELQRLNAAISLCRWRVAVDGLRRLFYSQLFKLGASLQRRLVMRTDQLRVAGFEWDGTVLPLQFTFSMTLMRDDRTPDRKPVAMRIVGGLAHRQRVMEQVRAHGIETLRHGGIEGVRCAADAVSGDRWLVVSTDYVAEISPATNTALSDAAVALSLVGDRLSGQSTSGGGAPR